MLEERIARLEKRLERANRARQAAENLLEAKSAELFEANQALQSLNSNLEKRVEARTAELEAQRQKAEKLALTDPLTGLANRLALNIAIGAISEGDPALVTGTAFFAIDLDRFKAINETCGHHTGDQVLKIIGQRLGAAINASDQLYRVGGDEFAILCHGRNDPAHLATQLHEILCEPMQAGDHLITIGASIGVAVWSDAVNSLGTLVTYANKSAYQAKARGGGIAVCDEKMALEFAAANSLESELAEAIELNEFEPWVQPIVEAVTLDLVGVEVLARWPSKHRGMVGPHVFIPIAERSGLIDRLAMQILDKACKSLAPLLADARLDYLSFNLSPIQLNNPDLAEQILKTAFKHDVWPSQLTIEITENLLISNTELVRQFMNKLSDNGITFVLDDFGIGYSNLRYLQDLPVERLKIDRSFLVDATANEAPRRIIAAITNLAHQMAIGVVVEGVETEAQTALVRNLECDYIQGFGIARPMPLNEFPGWLTNYEARNAQLSSNLQHANAAIA